MKHLPIFLDIGGKSAVVVGGGLVAERKVAVLAAAGARITVVAPIVVHGLAAKAADGIIAHVAQHFSPELIAGARFVIAATDDPQINALVAESATTSGILVNVVDDPEHSTCILPAIIDRDPVIIAVGTGGAAPVLARAIRSRIEALLDDSIGRLARFLDEFRTRIRAHVRDVGNRRAFYEQVLAGPIPRLIANHREEDAREAMDASLAVHAARRDGRVILVGAGPGDPGLLTLNAVRALQSADVVLYDRLVTPEILAYARRDAVTISVGKCAGGSSTPQDAINELMVTHAAKGAIVVRLKGGDPFLFGRGAEELEYVRAAGISFEVVPGITSATACAAYAGIPLTHRDHAASVRLSTAHRSAAAPLAAPVHDSDTHVYYMGVARIAELQAELIDAGVAPTMPIAFIENGTRANQRVLTGTLAEASDVATTHAIRSPALLIVGPTAALAARLHWFGSSPAGLAPLTSVAEPRQVA